MITVVFGKNKNGLLKVVVSGHAGYGTEGTDIVCAAVSSALQLTANAITDILKADAMVTVDGETVELVLSEHFELTAQKFLEALYLHLNILAEEYSDYIDLTVMEV